MTDTHCDSAGAGWGAEGEELPGAAGEVIIEYVESYRAHPFRAANSALSLVDQGAVSLYYLTTLSGGMQED